MVCPALLPPMRTPRLPAVDCTDAPADLNWLVHFAERWNLVSAHVPSHFKRSLLQGKKVTENWEIIQLTHYFLRNFPTHLRQVNTARDFKVSPHCEWCLLLFSEILHGVSIPETSETNKETTPHNIPEELRPQIDENAFIHGTTLIKNYTHVAVFHFLNPPLSHSLSTSVHKHYCGITTVKSHVCANQ